MRFSGNNTLLSILNGTAMNTAIRFNRYKFLEDCGNKENHNGTTDFLRKVENIFADDIVGTPLSTVNLESNVSLVNEDIADVAEKLEEVGFRTPRLYLKRKCAPEGLRRSRADTESSGCQEEAEVLRDGTNGKLNVSRFEAGNCADHSNGTDGTGRAESNTPVRKEKSYLRQTVASSKKRIFDISEVGRNRPRKKSEQFQKTEKQSEGESVPDAPLNPPPSPPSNGSLLHRYLASTFVKKERRSNENFD